MTTIDLADGTSPTVARQHHTNGGPIRFAAHVVEMLVVMTVGMTIGGPLGIPGVAIVELRAILWLLAMTIPMVAWMSLRGMSTRSAIEMAAAMALPTLVLLPFFWAGFVSGPTLICLEHSLMTPAMVALMVVRRGHYGWARLTDGGRCTTAAPPPIPPTGSHPGARPMRPLYLAIALTGVVALAAATSTVAASLNSAPPGVTISDPAPAPTAAAGDPSTVTLRIGGDLIRIALPSWVNVAPQRSWFGWCAPWRVFRPN